METVSEISANNGHVFKYRSFNLEHISDICIEGNLLYSTAKQLNEHGNEDFDLLITNNIDYSFKDLLIYNQYKQDIVNLSADKIKDELEKVLPSIKIELSNELSRKLKELYSIFNQHKETIINHYKNQYQNNYGILSLATDNKSWRMWEKYAENYSEIVIKFDLSKQYFWHDENSPQRDVDYNPVQFNDFFKWILSEQRNLLENVYFFQKYKKFRFKINLLWKIH